MKRQLIFNYLNDQDKYVIQEDGKTLFSIDGKSLEFSSLAFYQSVYAGNKSTAIDFQNKIDGYTSDLLKKGNYIFGWISEIFKEIDKKLLDQKEFEGQENGKSDNNVNFADDPNPSEKSKM